jgi:formylglycine-generating enzyme required for sulfatase activity
MEANPSTFTASQGGGPDYPVHNVNWFQAMDFCKRLSELPAESKAGRRYRLPKEAEWEYACRANTTTPFHTGATLQPDQAQFDATSPYGGARKGEAPRKTSAVGSFAANAFGVFDMHGNVQEWCLDGYSKTYPKPGPDGLPFTQPDDAALRVLRGGAYQLPAGLCRSASRHHAAPATRSLTFGFRVVCEINP